MKNNKNLYKIVKDLDKLKINSKQRRDLIESCYGCLGRFFGFDTSLETNISSAYERKLTGEKAYKFITENIEEYDKSLAMGMLQENPFYE